MSQIRSPVYTSKTTLLISLQNLLLPISINGKSIFLVTQKTNKRTRTKQTDKKLRVILHSFLFLILCIQSIRKFCCFRLWHISRIHLCPSISSPASLARPSPLWAGLPQEAPQCSPRFFCCLPILYSIPWQPEWSFWNLSHILPLFCSKPSTASRLPHYKALPRPTPSHLSGPTTHHSSVAHPALATLVPSLFLRPASNSAFPKLFLWAGMTFLPIATWLAPSLDAGPCSNAPLQERHSLADLSKIAPPSHTSALHYFSS